MIDESNSENREPRNEGERRHKPTPMLSRFLLFGRRRANRRADERREGYYVDRFGGKYIAAAAAVLVLCALDGVMTLSHLSAGGEELNPVMAYILHVMGDTAFLVIKYGITAFGIFFLLLHKNFRFVPQLTVGIVAMYSLLILYQIFLLIYRLA